MLHDESLLTNGKLEKLEKGKYGRATGQLCPMFQRLDIIFFLSGSPKMTHSPQNYISHFRNQGIVGAVTELHASGDNKSVEYFFASGFIIFLALFLQICKQMHIFPLLKQKAVSRSHLRSVHN